MVVPFWSLSLQHRAEVESQRRLIPELVLSKLRVEARVQLPNSLQGKQGTPRLAEGAPKPSPPTNQTLYLTPAVWKRFIKEQKLTSKKKI